MTTMASLLAFLCFQNPVFAGNLDTEASSLKWLGAKITGKHFGSLTFADGEITQKDGQWTGGSFKWCEVKFLRLLPRSLCIIHHDEMQLHAREASAQAT